MSTIILFSSLLFVSITYNYIISMLEYKIPLETLRLRRIKQRGIRKKQLEHKIERLSNRVFKKERQKARAFKKIERMKKSIKQIDKDLLYLANYGEKV